MSKATKKEEPINEINQETPTKEEIEIVFEPIETEVQFLERLLHIQHAGGWGKHLDEIINERIKILA